MESSSPTRSSKPLAAAAAVLAGGRGRRFGGNKPSAPWKDGTLLEAAVDSLRPLFTDVMVCAKGPAPAIPGTIPVRDGSRLFHPLAGLIAALEASRRPWVFLRGADMPLLSPALVRALWRARGTRGAVVPLWKGRPEPLCAFYHRGLRPSARAALARQEGLQQFLAGAGARTLPEAAVRRADPEGASFRDADTPEDLALMAAFSVGKTTA